MKRLAYFFLNSSIGNKLMCYFLFLILFPTILITSLSNLIYKNSMISQQDAYTEQMVRQISSNVDSYIKDTENVINCLSEDPRIMQFMSEYDRKNDDKTIKKDAYNAIINFTTFHPEIAGIMVVNANDAYVSDVMNRVSRDPLTSEKWYVQSKENIGKVQLFSKPIGRNISNIFQYSADDVVSLSKAVTKKNSNEFMGVILVDMKLDTIKDVIGNAKPGKMGFVYIVDSKGQIVYSPVNVVVYRIKDEWLKNLDLKMQIREIKGKNYEIMYENSQYTEWRTIGVFPRDESLKVITYIKYYSICIAVFTLVLAGILAVFFAGSIAKPIAKLKKLMKKTEEGNFNVHFNSKYNDEIGQLGNTFNNMIKKIRDLIKLVQIEEKKKRKAEIRVLEAQIKPHFIYNTLDTIQWMAQEHDADDIVEIVGNLTNLLRIGLSNGAEIIKLKQELKHAESYLAIQKVRYEDKLNYEINIDQNILSYYVIKLILQPLIENAIYHGIKEKRGAGKIIITGGIEDDKILIKIFDNGIGIKKDKLNEINTLLNSNSPGKREIGYGIFNVNERIKLNYGDEYGLYYHSTYGKGTVVDIWYPIVERGPERDN